jgi:mono/diheme cytochrome c family protein
MKPGGLLTVAALAGCFVAGDAVAAPGPLPAPVHSFFNTYCFGCHGEATAKAGLSLETLRPDFAAPGTLNRWVRVHDRLAAGEMPPKGKAQPPAEERRRVTEWLGTKLHDASLDRQRREGRVALRRLNRTEYENTLRDLLGVSVELRELLPEDTTVAGFDTVSAGLATSAQHLIRYQKAADRAIAAAIPTYPSWARKTRTTGREVWERWWKQDARSAELHLSRSARLEGDGLVFFQQTEGNPYLEFEFGEPAVPGRYRLRASVSARNSGGKPLAVLFFRVGVRRENDPAGDKRVITVHDAPAGKPAVIEEEVMVTDDPRFGVGHRIALKGWGLPEQKHPDEIRKEIAAGRSAALSGPGLAVDWVELEGPLGPHPPVGYRRMFGELPLENRWLRERRAGGRPPSAEEARQRPWDRYVHDPLRPVSAHPKADAERLIRSFLPRAFRRPVPDAVASRFVRFAHERLDRGYEFADAMAAAYRAALCSPHFLFRVEKPGPLDDYAVASRLSYFLWSSCPDDALLARGAKGELRKPEVLRAEVERMLADVKARRFTENFTGQWLDLRKLTMTKPDLAYVEYDEQLLWSMPLETTKFFDEVLARDRSVTEFVRSDWTFLNRRLAQHYGVPGVESWELRRVPLPPDVHRGGVITQAAVLKVTANGTTTSPVLRGKWVLDKIVGKPPPPPPPNLPVLEPDVRGAKTFRQQLEKHRGLPACATCHVHIDPPGFALETYDVIGGWRDWYRGRPDGAGGKERVELANYPGKQVWRGPDVEKGYRTPDGRAFRDIDEYRQILAEDEDQLARNLARMLIVYGTGADIQFADREVVEQIVREAKARRHGLRSLIHAVVRSRVFLNK